MREPVNKGRSYPPEALRQEEARGVLDACGASSTGLRNAAYLVLMYRAGLRSGEACDIRPEEIEWGRRGATIYVQRPKGYNRARGKKTPPRVVGLDQKAAKILRAWADERARLGLNGGPLICTLQGGRLQGSYVRTLLPRLALQAGVVRRVHPHALRHTFAFEAYFVERQTAVWVMKALGHTSLATTQTYLDHLCPTEVTADMQGRQW